MSYNRLLEKGDNTNEDAAPERSSFESHLDSPLCPSCQRNGRLRRRLAFLTPLTLLLISILAAVTLGQTVSVKSSLAKEQEVNHHFYGHDREYMSLDHKYDHLWEADAAGRGTVMLPLQPGGQEVVGLIGMFHQLHCLAGIRKALQRAREGDDPGVDDTDDPHWPHCFYHMRQAIHCHADDTIERQLFQNGTLGTPGITGQWDVRRCRNSEKLYTLNREHPG